MERYQLEKGFILTESDEKTEEIQHEGKSYTVIILPVWKFLLSRDFIFE